jgi:hypothetical protein
MALQDDLFPIDWSGYHLQEAKAPRARHPSTHRLLDQVVLYLWNPYTPTRNLKSRRFRRQSFLPYQNLFNMQTHPPTPDPNDNTRRY